MSGDGNSPVDNLWEPGSFPRVRPDTATLLGMQVSSTGKLEKIPMGPLPEKPEPAATNISHDLNSTVVSAPPHIETGTSDWDSLEESKTRSRELAQPPNSKTLFGRPAVKLPASEAARVAPPLPSINKNNLSGRVNKTLPLPKIELPLPVVSPFSPGAFSDEENLKTVADDSPAASGLGVGSSAPSAPLAAEGPAPALAPTVASNPVESSPASAGRAESVIKLEDEDLIEAAFFAESEAQPALDGAEESGYWNEFKPEKKRRSISLTTWLGIGFTVAVAGAVIVLAMDVRDAPSHGESATTEKSAPEKSPKENLQAGKVAAVDQTALLADTKPASDEPQAAPNVPPPMQGGAENGSGEKQAAGNVQLAAGADAPAGAEPKAEAKAANAPDKEAAASPAGQKADVASAGTPDSPMKSDVLDDQQKVAAEPARQPKIVELEPRAASSADVTEDKSTEERSKEMARSSERERSEKVAITRKSDREKSRRDESRKSTRRHDDSAKFATGPGLVNIASSIRSEIYIDGKKTGHWAPRKNLELPAGKHKITLISNEAAKKQSKWVTIAGGKATSVAFEF